MKIKEIISQIRRDFKAIYECEHCGNIEEDMGYDDSYFNNTVIPNKKCRKCGLKANKEEYAPNSTKYSDGVVV